jgi:hypothetical protein
MLLGCISMTRRTFSSILLRHDIAIVLSENGAFACFRFFVNVFFPLYLSRQCGNMYILVDECIMVDRFGVARNLHNWEDLVYDIFMACYDIYPVELGTALGQLSLSSIALSIRASYHCTACELVRSGCGFTLTQKNFSIEKRESFVPYRMS